MPQPVGRYVYWSQRLVTELIDAKDPVGPRIKPALNLGLAGNGVSLTGRDQENTTYMLRWRSSRRGGTRSIVSNSAPP